MKRYIIAVLSLWVIIDLSPLYCNYPLIQEPNTTLANVLASPNSLIPCFFSVGSCLPMLVDIIFYSVHRDKFFLSERMLLLIGCLLPACACFTRSHEKGADIYVCLSAIQSMTMAAALCNGMTYSTSSWFKKTHIYALFTLACVSQVRNTLGTLFLIHQLIVFLYVDRV